MHNKTRESSTQANLFVLVCLSMMTILLIWNATIRVDNFATRQTELAEHSVHAAADSVALLLDGYRRAVRIFADGNQAFISSVAEWPQDAGLYAILEERITTYFPEYFTFTLADKSGETILEGFEGLVGPRCRNDIQDYAVSDSGQQTYMHQGRNGEKQHFDIMAHWGGKEPDGSIFFISFGTDTLKRTLTNTGVAGHRIYLLRRDDPGLIDLAITGNGNSPSGNERLGTKKMQRISFSAPVPGTLWDVAILPNKSLYADAYSAILVQSLIIFIGFVIISIIMRMLLLNE
jgi:hypothetical protein